MTFATDETDACKFIINLVYERSRIRLHEGKQAFIQARLSKRLRHHGMSHLADYCHYLRGAEGEQEITHLINALTTNFTNFMRERNHFDFLVEDALPKIVAGQKRFQVWSAACASGEEPYTIAMFLAEHFPLSAGWDWTVRATDISTKALDHARRGIYPSEKIEPVSLEWRRKYFQRGTGQWDGHCRVKESLQSRVRFQQINLLAPGRHPETFPVIFCRNVMIYFDRPTQEQLVCSLSEHLPSGGFLLVGHAESLNGLSVPLHCLRPSVYRKI